MHVYYSGSNLWTALRLNVDNSSIYLGKNADVRLYRSSVALLHLCCFLQNQEEGGRLDAGQSGEGGREKGGARIQYVHLWLFAGAVLVRWASDRTSVWALPSARPSSAQGPRCVLVHRYRHVLCSLFNCFRWPFRLLLCTTRLPPCLIVCYLLGMQCVNSISAPGMGRNLIAWIEDPSQWTSWTGSSGGLGSYFLNTNDVVEVPQLARCLLPPFVCMATHPVVTWYLRGYVLCMFFLTYMHALMHVGWQFVRYPEHHGRGHVGPIWHLHSGGHVTHLLRPCLGQAGESVQAV